MSFMIHLQSFNNKEIYNFSRSIVWEIFGPKACPTNEGWGLMYRGRNGGILYLDDNDLIDGCGINRPSNDAIRDLFSVAQKIPSAINADANFFVTDPAFIAGMPDWLLHALPKPPKVVLNADQLLRGLAGK